MLRSDPNSPDIFVGGHRVFFEASAGKKKVRAHAAKVKPKAQSAKDRTVMRYREAKVKPRTHLKTQGGWIIGCVPPGPGGKPRKFFSNRLRKSKKRGYPVHYWGYVTFDGKKHYGWVDAHRLTSIKKVKREKKLKSYQSYVSETAKLVKAIIAYKRLKKGTEEERRANSKKVARPVLYFITMEQDAELYFHPDPTKEHHKVGRTLKAVRRKLDEHTKLKGVSYGVRWYNDHWILGKEVGGRASKGKWFFVQRQPGSKLIKRSEGELRPTKPRRAGL
jgi:hypothetical protein